MKITLLKNGDMIVSHGTKPVFVILGIAIFLFFSKGAFMWVFSSEDVQGNRFLAIAVIALTILFFYRMISLSSKFKFSSAEKNLSYNVQHPFSNKKGIVSIESIEKAILETDSEGASRIVIKCKENRIPMSLTVEHFGVNDSIVTEINEWLEKNKNT